MLAVVILTLQSPPPRFPYLSLFAGKHEGTVLGVTYFTAPKKRGTFVRRENLTPYNPELEAAGKMQAFARMANAKKKAKKDDKKAAKK